MDFTSRCTYHIWSSVLINMHTTTISISIILILWLCSLIDKQKSNILRTEIASDQQHVAY